MEKESFFKLNPMRYSQIIEKMFFNNPGEHRRKKSTYTGPQQPLIRQRKSLLINFALDRQPFLCSKRRKQN
jgi:hypothetical protein